MKKKLLYRSRRLFSRHGEEEMDLRSLLELTPDGVIGVDMNGVITLVNAQAEQLFGYEADEVIGMEVEALMPNIFGTNLLGGRTEYLSVPSERAMGTGLELYGRLKDGTEFPVECASTPHSMRGDQVVLVFVRDITKRRLAEDALIQREQQLRRLVHTSLDAVIGMDAAGTITSWNPQSEVIFGWSRDEAIGKPLDHVIIPRRYREAHQKGLRRFLVTGDTRMIGTRIEIQALHRDGHEIEVEVAVMACEVGNTYTFFAFMRDITERIHAKALLERQVAERTAKLAESEGRLKEAQRMAALGYWEYDLRTGETWWSDELFEIMGFPKGETPSYEEICHRIVSHDRDRVGRTFDSLVAAGGEAEREYRIHHPDTGVRYLFGRIRLVTDEAGHALQVHGVERDVTQARLGEKALEEARIQAEEANRAKSRFFSSMSHEIRTPLNAILGYSQLLGRDSDLSTRARDRVNLIIESGDHLLSLIDEVLDISKIEAGGLALEIGTVDLHELLDRVGRMTRFRAEAKELELGIHKDESLPRHVRTDDKKLQQILINILDNAVKFTQTGTITLRAFADQTEAELIKLFFEVTDTGEGIAEEELDRVFAAFEQTASGQKTHKGTGLGMRISRDLARLMGGDLTVQSKLGVGSTFTLEIVARRGEADDARVIAQPSGPVRLAEGQRVPTVLVVDDLAENRQLLRLMLESGGLEVEEAQDGEQAIGRFAWLRPDLVLMDLKMPGIDGLEASRRIRQTKEGEKVPIVAVSASVYEDDRKAVAMIGINDFIRKPFREARLWEVIGEQLGLELVYEAPEAVPPSRIHLSREAILALGKEWLAIFRYCVEGGDQSRAVRLVDELGPERTEIAAGLRVLLSQYDYEAILELVSDEPLS